MSNPILFYSIVFGSMFAFGCIGVYALYWAAKNGQMKNLEDGSKVIFDKDECVGKTTDAFPHGKEKKTTAAGH